MQTEVFYEAGRNLAAEAIAAEGALKELEKQECEWIHLQQSSVVAQDGVIHGLALAIPISLALWMAIGALLWAITR